MRLIPAGDLASAEPTIAIRWCLDRVETDALKEAEATNIHILFVISYEGSDMEDRLLVPAEEMITYLNFRRAGKHTVFAKVVYGYNVTPKGKENFLKKHSHNSYYNAVLETNKKSGEKYLDTTLLRKHSVRFLLENGEETLQVIVPKEHFPKEWPDWVKRIVNVWSNYPAVDQCEFRRRICWLPLKLVMLFIVKIISTAVRILMATVLGLMGVRHIGWSAIVHPMRDSVGDVMTDVKILNNWFMFKNDEPYSGSRYSDRSGWIYLLHPFLYIAMFVFVTMWKRFLHTTYQGLFQMVVEAIGVALFRAEHWIAWIFSKTWLATTSIVLFMLFMFGLFYLVRFAKKLLSETIQSWKDTPESRLAQQNKKNLEYDELYKRLACKPNVTADVSSIPFAKRSIHLQYLHIKAKVCRPFAAS